MSTSQSKEAKPVDKRMRLKKIGAIGLGALATLKVACTVFGSGDDSKKDCPPGQTFLGSGIRAKGPISVYNVDMYVGDRAKSALSAFKGKDLKKDKAFIDAFEKGGFQKTIKITMLRSVAPEKMVSSFNDAVSTRVSKKALDKIETPLNDLLTKAFSGSASQKGSAITFSMMGGKSFSISVQGKAQGSVWSSDLCKAFTDIYVGSKPVSSGAKDSIITGLQEMINA